MNSPDPDNLGEYREKVPPRKKRKPSKRTQHFKDSSSKNSSQNRDFATCGATGKRGYYKKADAKYIIGQMKAQGGKNLGCIRAFKCKHCLRYHIGHQGKLSRSAHRLLHSENPEILDCRIADDNNVVLTVKNSEGRAMKNPCPECPWRRVNAGNFPAEAFRISSNTALDASPSMFGCHMSGADHCATCAGFILSQTAADNVGLRLAFATGRINADDYDFEADRPNLFQTYRQMAEANGVSADDECLKHACPEGKIRRAGRDE